MVPSTTVLCLLLGLLLCTSISALSFTALTFNLGIRPGSMPTRNVHIRAVGNTTDIFPTTLGTVDSHTAIFDLPDHGEYDVYMTEPGYYFYHERFTFDDAHNSAILWLVPLSQGVSIMYDGIFGNFNVFPKMVFPEGVFDFNVASLIPTWDQNHPVNDYNYGHGIPPPVFLNLPWLYVLGAAPAGTYRYYMEVLNYDSWPPEYVPESGHTNLNYTDHSANVHLFAGYDHNGWVGNYRSVHQLARSWYLWDLVVTNPNPGCSRYALQTVDLYSMQTQFSEIDHGNGTTILEECYDVSAPAVACYNQVFPSDEPTRTCGVFGDPHIVLFDGTGVTCGNETQSTLIENEYFILKSENTIVNVDTGATTISRIRFQYKGSCNPVLVSFSESGEIDVANINSPVAGHHSLRVVGNNIFIDAIHLRVQVRSVNGLLVFGASIPESLAANSTGICNNSCPAGTLMSLDSSTKRSSTMTLAAASSSCSAAGLVPGTFEYDACVHDVTVTGNSDFANVAATSTVVRQDVSQPWQPADAPSAVPTPTGSSSSLSTPFILLAILVCLALISVW